MLWCMRGAPLIAVVVLLVRARALFGLGQAGAAARAASTRSVGLGWMHATSALVSQAFAWLFLLIGLSVVYAVLHFIVEEIKLRRMYDNPKRAFTTPRRRRGR